MTFQWTPGTKRLIVTKSKCIRNNYTNYKKMNVTSGSGIFETIHANNCNYLLLFGKRELMSFEISRE